MGYRSDVEIVVYAPEEIFLAWIASIRLNKPDLYKDMRQHAEILETYFQYRGKDTKYLMMHVEFNGVKWYPSYEDVKIWEGMISDIDANYKQPVHDEVVEQLEYECCICGEGLDDIQFRNSYNAEWVLEVHKYSELQCLTEPTDYWKEQKDVK